MYIGQHNNKFHTNDGGFTVKKWCHKLRFEKIYQRKNRAMVELFYAFVVIVVLVGLSFTAEMEFVETLYNFTRRHEEWELDELLFSFFWVAIVVSIYAIRRVIDIVNLSKSNEYNANHDSLTGLPNRYFAQILLTKMLHRAKRYNHSVAVLFLDLNNFKDINDSFGHDHGDMLVEQIGQRLSAIVRTEEVASRLGGDEFLIIAELCDEKKIIAPIVERIHECTHIPFNIYGKSIKASFSIGIAISPEHGNSVKELMAAADAAMYEAKRNKNAPAFYYKHEVGERNNKYFLMSLNLKSALINKELYLVFQPIVNTYTGLIEGYEALTRWEFEGEQVNPELLVSIAENIGLSDGFFQWLMDTAARESSFFQVNNQFISINVTVKQFLSNNFFQ